MREISGAVQEGAAAYLRKQYTTIAVVAIAPILLIGFYNELGWGTAFGFVIGAVLSAAAGFIGMNVAVRSNARTAEAAREGSPGIQGRVPGRLRHGPPRRRPRPVRRRRVLLVPHRRAREQSPNPRSTTPRPRLRRLADLGLRATRRRHLHEGRRRRCRPRRQDRGRDSRGRPRNPAVIADNVGDNVGDCAGMAADLFETYAVTAVAVMLLGTAYPTGDLWLFRWRSVGSRSSPRSSARSSPESARATTRSSTRST